MARRDFRNLYFGGDLFPTLDRVALPPRLSGRDSHAIVPPHIQHPAVSRSPREAQLNREANSG